MPNYHSHIKLLVISLFSFLIFNVAIGQNDQKDDLAFYADVLTNASHPRHRVYANERFIKALDQTLNEKESFGNPLENVPWVFVRYDPSKKFRFISWQLEYEEKQFKYFTYFQNSDGDLFKIQDLISDIELREVYSPDNLYSSIIHQIVPVDNYYLLASYRQNSSQTAQKICEVLTFESGKPIFGKSIFYENEGIPDGRGKKRVVMSYSPAATASMNFNFSETENVIVFDHIISMPGKTTREGMMRVPDGTFEAYIQQSSHKWLYNANLYAGLEFNPKLEQRPSSRRPKKPE